MTGMEKALRFLMVSLATVTLLTACAEPPNEELSAAKTALQAVVSAGAESSHADAMQSINRKYKEALDEIKSQESVTFGKDYGLAKFTLNQVFNDSNELMNKIRTEKGEPTVAYAKRSQTFDDINFGHKHK
jgi:hypothetical protein